MGVMEEIRGLLSTGRGSGEIIAQGYRPGTVYRAQRDHRRNAAAIEASQPENGHTPHEPGVVNDDEDLAVIVAGLNEGLDEVMECLSDLIAERDTLLRRVAALETALAIRA